MFADATELSVDAVCTVAHAMSTHRSGAELDFFSAVDENKPSTYQKEEDDEGQGSAMIDFLEFTTGTFYHYASINLTELEARLPKLEREERQAIVREFTKAFALAVPGARRTSMNADTRPAFVLATVQTGQPLQLVNAFESPVKPNGHGYVEESVLRLTKHLEDMEKVWGLKYDLKKNTPNLPFEGLLDKVVEHVL
jgi:CRISPR system Cascade subunit CasC